MLQNKSIFQISTLICLSSISICNLLIDLSTYVYIYMYGLVFYIVTPVTRDQLPQQFSNKE
jgi:hypothetical protein